MLFRFEWVCSIDNILFKLVFKFHFNHGLELVGLNGQQKQPTALIQMISILILIASLPF